jgi:predicted Zn-dependent peptidase
MNAFLLAALAYAGATPPIERLTLDNGLEVILAPDHSTPIVAVNVWYHVGSRDETAGLTGFAHLFEHLMFQGSPSNLGEYFAPLEEVGADVNGSTNTDRTNYFEVLPARHLPLALWLESDRMGGLLEVLDQSWLDNQREVVRNERRQRYENTPYGEVMVWIQAEMYPEGHPYHHTTIGSHEDLERANLDAVKAFFAKWYVPNNATLVVAGDFEPAVARKLVTEQFGWIPRGEEPARVTPPGHGGSLAEVPSAALAAPKVRREYSKVPERKLWMVWHSAPADTPGDAELDLLSGVLAGDASTRLEKVLVREQQIAKEVAAYQLTRPLGSLFVVQATAAPGHTTDEVAAVAQVVLNSVAGASPPTEAEVEGARAQIERQLYGQISQVGRRADTLNSFNQRFGDPNGLDRELARYRVTADAVRDAARVTASPHLELHVLPLADEHAEPSVADATPPEPVAPASSGCATAPVGGALLTLGALAVLARRNRGGVV